MIAHKRDLSQGSSGSRKTRGFRKFGTRDADGCKVFRNPITVSEEKDGEAMRINEAKLRATSVSTVLPVRGSCEFPEKKVSAAE